MNQAEMPAFSKLMRSEAELYPNAAATTPARIQAYFESLERFDLESIRTVLKQLREQNEFFPSIKSITESLEGSGSDRAAQAFSVLLEAVQDGGNASVKFLDPSAAVAVDVTFGGYLQAARSIHEADEPMIAHYRKAYAQAYLTARKFPRETETYRVGNYEFQNAGGGTWAARMQEYSGPVRLIGMREVKEVRLPFDPQTGKLTGEARLMVEAANTEQGARRLLAEGVTKAPKMLSAAPSEPINHSEAKAFLKEIEDQTGVSLVKQISANSETEEEYAARVAGYRDALLEEKAI